MSQEEIDKQLKKSKIGDEVVLDIRYSDLQKGIRLIKTCRNIVLNIHTTIIIELDIDPNDPKVLDDKYILFSTDKKQKYYKELTVKDDMIQDDKKITLEFEDVYTDLNYSLKIDMGEDGHYLAFTDLPYLDLIEEPNE
jgi:hypothetical protein